MKERILTLCLCIISCVGFTGLINAKEPSDLRAIHFTQTIDSLKKGRILEHKIWMKNDKLRMEYMQQGQLFVLIINNKQVYTYLPSRKFGTVTKYEKDALDNYQIKPEMMQSVTRLKDHLTLMQAQKVGQEKIYGQKCDIYQFKDPHSHDINTLWISQELQFPLKSQTKLAGDILTIHYKNIEISRDLKDHLFVVANDIRIEPLQSNS